MKRARPPYTFAVLRYTHDVVTGEFVNVGVVLYAPTIRYLRAKCTNAYGRLSRFFGHVEGDPFKQVMRRIEDAVSQLDERVFDHIRFSDPPQDALACAAQVLPKDDSSLTFASGGAGIMLSDPDRAIEQLFERYVERYAKLEKAEGRTDQDVWSAFRRPLQERHLLPRLRPKIIAAPDYEHEFPHAWKNGVWHACEAVSFDLTERTSIEEKANRWLGRGVNLKESKEPFKLYLLLGEPRDRALRATFDRAVNILRKMPLDFSLLRESQASELAKVVEETTRDDEGAG